MNTGVIEELVKRYENKPKSEWDEAQVRTSLLNPFWQALGWQIDNPRQVEVEKRIHMTEHTKFADYAFVDGKKIYFLLEAKSPAHNLVKDKDAIFQTKRYVWNTPETYLGILQDFEEFLPIIVLKAPDIRFPSVGLLKSRYMRYTEYVDRWDELVDMYSREAVLSGSLEKLLPKGTKLEKATEPVDRKFFNDLTEWRKEIASSIAKRNPDITDDRINEAVNDLLNRFLFIRVIEDRKIEPIEILKSEWKNWQYEQRGPLWAYLLDLFAKLNPKYNGTMFQKHTEDPLKNIIIDDKPLHNLIKNLYYPSPYQFSILPVEIIGNAYEKYLGSVIRTTPSRIVKLEEKPEVRKAGGVYYTPKYIVEYIVEQTLGRLLNGETPDTDKSISAPLDKGDKRAKASRGLTPRQVRKLKILDPACGSGSFLIGAFERLEKYYLDYYKKHPKENKGFLVKTPEGKTKLSFKIKKQILLDNLYGVDIDDQAVNITKFSLYVKLMEDENYMNHNVLFGQALLPDLKDNIKCGNSLIGWDILDMDIIPRGRERDEILKKINPFDWAEEFPLIMKQGGFDVVIGNPPYVHTRSGLLTDQDKAYWRGKYSVAKGQYDLFGLFIEVAVSLLNLNGIWSFIQPKRILSNEAFEPVRELLNTQLSILSFLDAGMPFQDANVECCVLSARKGKTNTPIQIYKESDKTICFERQFAFRDFTELPHTLMPFIYLPNEVSLAAEIASKGHKFGEIADITRGFECGMNAPEISKKKSNKDALPLITGEGVQRYFTKYDGYFANADWSNRSKWKTFDLYSKTPKILIRFVSCGVTAALDDVGYSNTNTLYDVHLIDDSSIFAVLALLNCRLINWWFKLIFLGEETLFPHVQKSQLILIPLIGNDNAELEILSKEMLDLHKRLAKATDEKTKAVIQKQIEITDRKIDALVYELYGLTDEEIRVVEGGE